MRARQIWPFFFTLFAIVTANWGFAQSGMRWQTNLESAKRLAAQTNRLVLVHFWTESCGPCMRMEREVFSRPDVAAAIEAHFVPVRINVRQLPQVARDFNVNSWPTDIVLTPKGEVLVRKTGGSDAAQYVAALNQIAAQSGGPAKQADFAQSRSAPGGPSPTTAGVNPGYASRYQQPAGEPPQQTTNPSRSYSPNYSGITQPSPSEYKTPSAAPSTQMRGQSWQAEPSQWNPGSPGALAGHAPARPPVQASPATDRSPAPSDAYRTAGQPWAGQSSTGGSAAIGQTGSAPPNSPASDARPANPPLALDGYCPVVLLEKERWVRGDPRYGVIHRGRTYLFSGPEEARRFFADPDRYAPVLSGIDVVVAVEENRQVPGKREYGAWYEGRMYLFSSEASFRKFDQDPARYAAAATQVAQASSRLPYGRSGPSAYDRGPMR